MRMFRSVKFSRTAAIGWAFLIVVSGTILALNVAPLVFDIRHSPPGRTFAKIHNNAQDFFFYLAMMNEGGSGDLLTSDPFTTEPHQPSIIFAYFVWLGRLSRMLGIPYEVAYHAVRLVFGAILLASAWRLIKRFRVPYPYLTFLFFIFASPFMHTVNEWGTVRSVPYMHWWTGMDAVRRIAYLPHHMVGNVLLVVSLLLVAAFVRSGDKRLVGLLLAISSVLAFVHTPSLMIILMVLPVAIGLYSLLEAVRQRPVGRPAVVAARLVSDFSGRLFRPRFVPLWGYMGLSLVFMYIMVSQTGKGFPWSQYIAWEKNLQFPLEKELLPAFGLILPLTLVGLLGALSEAGFERLLLACWFAVPLAFIPFAKNFNLSNIRLTQGVPYLALAANAGFGLTVVDKFVSRKLSGYLDRLRVPAKLSVLKRYLVPLVVFVIFAVQSAPVINWSVRDQIREYFPIFGNVYFDDRLKTAFAFIDSTFPPKTPVLGTFYSGNYLPAYTHTVSYVGHFGYTYDIDRKQPDVFRFFKGEMSQNEAAEYMKRNGIKAVFQGPEEKPLYTAGKLYPTVLSPIYDREEATIYVLRQ